MTSDACLQDFLASLKEKIQRRKVLYMNEYNKAFHGLAFDKVAERLILLKKMRENIKTELGIDESDRKAIL